jgi:glycine/D-amino acid oxidase-like deaminating enzyme
MRLFEIGHDLRDRKTFALDGVPVAERYDLVVVGGGISGLAAAWFYRRASRKRASSSSTITTISAGMPSATNSASISA